MLIYNLLIITVAFLLYLDYVFHKNHTQIIYGGNAFSIGNTFIYMALMVIILFSGLRFEIGYDYLNYLAGYLYDSELIHWEPFFTFLIKLVRDVNFGLGIQAMFLLFSALIMIVTYKALRTLTVSYRLGILFYLFVPSLFLSSMSVIRQGIALAILLYGLQYITHNVNYKKYMLVAFVAFMFHYSSIFVVLIYVLGAHFFQRSYSWITYSFLLAISFFLSFAHIGKYILLAMPGRFALYANFELHTSTLKLLVINLFFMFFMLQKDKFIKSRLEHYLLNSVFIGLLIYNIFSDFVFMSRLAQYFLAVEILLVPIYLYSIKDIFMRKIMLIFFLFYYLMNFNYALYRDIQYGIARPNVQTLIPYKNYLFEENKSERTLNIEAWYNFILEDSLREEQEGQ